MLRGAILSRFDDCLMLGARAACADVALRISVVLAGLWPGDAARPPRHPFPFGHPGYQSA